MSLPSTFSQADHYSARAAKFELCHRGCVAACIPYHERLPVENRLRESDALPSSESSDRISTNLDSATTVELYGAL